MKKERRLGDGVIEQVAADGLIGRLAAAIGRRQRGRGQVPEGPTCGLMNNFRPGVKLTTA